MHIYKIKHLIYLLCFISIISSCKKDEEDTPTPTTDSNTSTEETSVTTGFYPLKIGNSWTYYSTAFGEYTVNIVSEKIIDNETWFVAENEYENGNPTTTSFMKSEDNKIITRTTQVGIGEFDLILFNGNAKVGESYKAGTVNIQQAGSSTENIYTGEIKEKLASYTVGETAYKDIVVVEFTTSTSAFFDEAYYRSLGLDDEFIDFIRGNFNSSAFSITQTQYFANGIGLIYQESTDQPSLNANIVKYTVK